MLCNIRLNPLVITLFCAILSSTLLHSLMKITSSLSPYNRLTQMGLMQNFRCKIDLFYCIMHCVIMYSLIPDHKLYSRTSTYYSAVGVSVL